MQKDCLKVPNPHLIRAINPVDNYMLKQLLTDVVIIRPILIVLLVCYLYSGAWAPLPNQPDIPVYWWLDKLAYAFMLETFVFISGYVFGYQVRIKGDYKLQARVLFPSKLKRLIIPSMFFSLLYIILYGDINQPVSRTLYGVIDGTGHLWFLPMLFWCFVGIWLIERFRLSIKSVLPLLLVCSVCSFLPLPLHLGNAMYYMIFFYAGYMLKRKIVNLEEYYTRNIAIALIIAFILIFSFFTIIGEATINIGGYLGKAITLCLKNVMRILSSSIGLSMLFVTIGVILKRNGNVQIPQWLISVGNLCFGVYLLQQFILVALYRYTSLPVILGFNLLPWAGFVITFAGSVAGAFILRKTSLGRMLIG